MSSPVTDVTELNGEFAPELAPYRSMSLAAMLALILSVVSLAGILFPTVLVVALLGFVLGLYGYRVIRRYPDEYAGKIPALVGLVLSFVVLVAGVTFHSLVYATEVPEGYARVGFEDLQPSPDHPELPISPAALQLNGKRVFIKGYVYPDGQQSNIKDFVLVRDMGTCCFGGQPKLTHMVQVSLNDPLRVEYAIRKRRLGGILSVDTQLKPVSGLGGVYFQLKADYLR